MKSIYSLLLLITSIISILLFSSTLGIRTKTLKKFKRQNIIISKIYYPVKGLRYEKIIEEVKSKNLKSYRKNLISGGSVKAKFHLKPLQIPKPKKKICQLSSRDFYWIINIKYTLPQWKNRHLANQSLKKRWDKYLKRLIKHEDTHRDIFLEGAKAIHDYIENIPPYPLGKKDKNCLKYVSKVKDKILFIFKTYERKNLAFDLKTKFGLNNRLLL